MKIKEMLPTEHEKEIIELSFRRANEILNSLKPWQMIRTNTHTLMARAYFLGVKDTCEVLNNRDEPVILEGL